MCYGNAAPWDSNLNRNQATKQENAKTLLFAWALLPWLWAFHGQISHALSRWVSVASKPGHKYHCTGTKGDDQFKFCCCRQLAVVRQLVEKGNHTIEILAIADYSYFLVFPIKSRGLHDISNFYLIHWNVQMYILETNAVFHHSV